MRKSIIGYLCVLVSVVAPIYSMAQTVFAADYHVVLTIHDTQYIARSKVRVEDGLIIPVEFEHHRIDLEASSYKGDMFLVSVTIFERSNGMWVQKDDADPGGFGGCIGSFHGFDWNGDDMRLNMAITVSIVRS